MIRLHDNERMLLLLHRHWVVLLLPVSAILMIAILPLFIMNLVVDHNSIIIPWISGAVGAFVLMVYWLILLLIILIELVFYWLDVWMLTTERIIDAEQVGLFHREISEFGVENVQDVTVETPTLLATLLHFGTITIHTAGDKSFVFRDVPQCDHVREIIVNTQKQQTGYGGTLEVGTNKTQEGGY